MMNTKHEENNVYKINYEVAELRLQYPANNQRPQILHKINSSSDAYDLFKNNWSDQLEIIEEFNVLFLDRRNKVLGMMNVSKGGYAATVVDAKVIFSSALLAKASSIIAAHNHPSGNLKPSKQDIAMTSKLVEAGKVLDLPIIDHLIITNESYYSFADEGLL